MLTIYLVASTYASKTIKNFKPCELIFKQFKINPKRGRSL